MRLGQNKTNVFFIWRSTVVLVVTVIADVIKRSVLEAIE
jgi:hypothetical protein